MGTISNQLLREAGSGDQRAAAQLTPLIYDELRALAVKHLRPGAGSDLTLQPTALVHEAFLKLVDDDGANEASQTHFRALAAVAMRHALIDHLRGRNRAKRGAGWERVTLSSAPLDAAQDDIDVQALDEALGLLSEVDSRAAKIVELRFFAGLSEKEIAEFLNVSVRTVRNDWSMARTWLLSRMGEGEQEE